MLYFFNNKILNFPCKGLKFLYKPENIDDRVRSKSKIVK